MPTILAGIRSWFANLPSICMLVITVWFPTNLTLNYLVVHSGDQFDDFWFARMGMWVEWLFSPIYVGAIIHVLAEHSRGRRVSFFAAMRTGLKNWGRLFLARLVAGIIVTLGFVYFIVPGVILAIRFSLLDAALIVERLGINAARKRSWQLTQGRFWLVLAVRLASTAALTLFSFTVYFAYHRIVGFGLVDLTIQIFAETVIDSFSDILATLVTAVLFQVYWDARGSVPDETGGEPRREFDQTPLGDDEDGRQDDNPYASPRR